MSRWLRQAGSPHTTQIACSLSTTSATAMGELMAVAEVVDKLQAICVVCGDPACRNQRLINGKPARYDSPTIMVGGRESYEARCRHCHKVPRKDEDQTALL